MHDSESWYLLSSLSCRATIMSVETDLLASVVEVVAQSLIYGELLVLVMFVSECCGMLIYQL